MTDTMEVPDGVVGYSRLERQITEDERAHLDTVLGEFTPWKIFIGSLAPIPVCLGIIGILWFVTLLLSGISPAIIGWSWVVIGAGVCGWLIFDVVRHYIQMRDAVRSALLGGRVREQSVKAVSALVVESDKESREFFLFGMEGGFTLAVAEFDEAFVKLPCLDFSILDFLTEAGEVAGREVRSRSEQLEMDAVKKRADAPLPLKGEVFLSGSPEDYIQD